jgi:hypothetical protein
MFTNFVVVLSLVLSVAHGLNFLATGDWGGS